VIACSHYYLCSSTAAFWKYVGIACCYYHHFLLLLLLLCDNAIVGLGALAFAGCIWTQVRVIYLLLLRLLRALKWRPVGARLLDKSGVRIRSRCLHYLGKEIL
jgi:hypothetical protein